MRHFLFASHGNFAEGIRHSVELIVGKQPNIWTLGAYVDENVDLKTQIKELFTKFTENDELIVVTDIFGGSVNNEFMNLVEEQQIHLIAGLNLPLVIELVTMEKQEKDTEKLIKSAIKNSRNSIKYCNSEIGKEHDDEEF
ncbi:PTS sugar transporter subunit IIA [Bacillus sp. JJ1764]|uniref:PTS sugar transporter subunit IIA n=1 Tax=Bacillus sp. JJ1764 TaxID=3122964 RepID=UPI002FFF4AD4